MSETSGAVGTWICTLMTPIGELQPTITLNADGTGAVDTTMGEAEILRIAYDGDSVTFSAKVHMPMGEIDLTVTGAAAGDDFSGTVEVPMGVMPITGFRQI